MNNLYSNKQNQDYKNQQFNNKPTAVVDLQF